MQERELTDEDYAEWRTHPVTERVMRYFKDRYEGYRSALEESLLNRTKINPEDLSDINHDLQSLRIVQDILDLEAEDINNFYEPEETTASGEHTSGV